MDLTLGRLHHKQHKTPVLSTHFSLYSIDSIMAIRVCFILALLVFSFSFLQVVVGEVDSAEGEGGDLGIVNDDVQDMVGGTYTAASGVHTVCVFPKNPSKIVVGGQDNELLVGVKNEGESSLHIIAIQASIHLPFDHRYLVQNLSVQAFNEALVPPSSQATFPYTFAVSKFLQAGAFDFVGTIIYEIDQTPYQSTFYNGTVEVTEASGPLTIETVFLVGLAVAVIGFLFYWARNQIQNISKKSKRAPKVEVGTSTIDASNDEWLQGTAYAQSLSSKSKKKK